jgi:hypothetical protein
MGLYGEQVVPRLVDLACGLAGFVMGRHEQRYARGFKYSSWLTVGLATKPVA